MTDRGAWSLAAGAAAAGALAGVFFADYWRRPEALAGAAAAGSPALSSAPSGTGADGPPSAGAPGGANPDLERQMRDLAVKLDGACQKLESAARALRDYHQSEAARPQPPGERAPGSLVPWLPPEGVPLVKAWFKSEFARELERIAEDEADEQSETGRRHRQAVRANVQEARDALTTVSDELGLAKWLATYAYILTTRFKPPQPWQLAELAQELARGGGDSGGAGK